MTHRVANVARRLSRCNEGPYGSPFIKYFRTNQRSPRSSSFVSRRSVKTPQSVHIGDLDPLTDDPKVLLIAEPLDRTLHGLDIEADTTRQVDRRDHQLDRPRPGSAPSCSRALTTFDCVSRSMRTSIWSSASPQTPDELRGCARRAVENARGGSGAPPCRSRDDRRPRARPPSTREQAPSVIAPSPKRSPGLRTERAPLDHADALEEPHASLGGGGTRVGPGSPSRKRMSPCTKGWPVLLDQDSDVASSSPGWS